MFRIIFLLLVMSLGQVFSWQLTSYEVDKSQQVNISHTITKEEVYSLANDSRSESGIPSLKRSLVLDKAAQAKADDMASDRYFAHVSPDGKTPWDFIGNAGYHYLTAGENLAINWPDARSEEE